MFNLLRRRVRRKNKNNKNKYNIDDSAGAAAATATTSTDAVQSSYDNVPKYCYTNDENGGEYYRQILEKNDEQPPSVAENAIANVGASITGKTSKTTRNGEKKENEGNLHINDVAISAGKIYFENARDKRRHLNQQQQQQQWLTNDKQVHLPQTTSDNFSLKLNEDAVNDHHYQLEKAYYCAEVEPTHIAKNEQQRQEASSSKKVEDVSYDHLACGFSHNELAERQRCVLTIGEYDEILLNRTNRPTITTTTTTTLETAEENQLNKDLKAFKTIANSENNRNLYEINVENVHKINNSNNTTTTTTTRAEGANENISTINNEVKYRNLDKTSRNEAKRQSRLSFTLAGINFGRKKEVDDRVKNDQDNNNEKSNFEKKIVGTKDILEVVAEPVVYNQTNINESNCKKKIKLNPFQKSREYLNNLFMARGRQQNRHQRQQQQQQQLQQQQQQASKQQQHCKNDIRTGGSGGGGGGGIATKVADNKMTSSCSKNIAKATSLHLNVTDSTNSYQIPLSKNTNNNTINSNQIEVSAHKNRERGELSRSNSATYATRTHSLSPQLRTKRSRSVTFSDVDHIIEDDRELWLLNRNHVSEFSRTGNIERGSSNLANITANDQFAHESNNNTINTHGVVGAEGVEFPTTTSAFVHTNNHLIQTSSHNTNEQQQQQSSNIYNNNRNNQEIDRDKEDVSKELLYTNKLNQIDNNKSNASTPSCRMGQTNTKPETQTQTPTREFRESSVSSTTSDRVKKVSFANVPEEVSSPININMPTITVADYSETLNSATNTPSDQEVFYDFDNSDKHQIPNDSLNYNTMTVDNDIEHDANFYIGAGSQSMSMNDHQYNNNGNTKWQIPNSVFLSQSQMRHNYVKLEDVREEDENENEEVQDDESEEEEEEEQEDDDEEESDYDEKEKRPRHLDNELYNSIERSPLKSSDTTLSGSPSDSGIGTDSQPTTPSCVKSRHSPTNFYTNSTPAAPTTTTTGSGIRNEPTNIQQLKQQIKQQYGFMSFVRDGNSTDCDEIPLHYDDIDLDLADDDSTNERLVCIESISLPDVVVESTAATSSSTTISSASSTTSSEHIINISSGASGNSMGNVHFIPIHIEGVSNGATNGTTKRRSSDDSVIGNGTIEITEDACVMNGHVMDNRQNEKLKRELAEQKSRFDVQLEDAQKNVQSLQSKVSEMQMKIEKLEQELSTKAWNVERLQGELGAAQKDDDYVRKKLKLLEDEKTALRHKYSENEDEFRRRYEELETQYKELEEKYKQTQHLASNLQTQLAMAQSEAEEWRQEVEKIRTELEEQIRVLKNALEYSEAERKICADKWQREFEMLRTQHQDREESLMTDCEWQLRQMQKQCKDKMDKSDFLRQEAAEKASRLESELTERQRQVNHLRQCQAEVKSLRGVVTEQESSIRSLMTQIDNLKAELQTANENLLSQMETVEKIKFQCNNALCDKERQMIYRIDEVRNEAAAFWEDKLYTEMTRLKNELESVYVDERREALDKLQDEHIEELKHLTNRYTLNEEELRAELNELQDRLDQKNAEFMELREKSDNALLQTRMHLDRADREYQNAMCREEQRREDLEVKLQKEFAEEKKEMEEKFEKRLLQAKESYAKELQIATANLSEKHKKDIEQQKLKMIAERDEAIQELADRHRQKLLDAEERMKDIELRHQRNLKDLKATYDTEKAALDKRDISNANEIEQLHRKCRCLTNLFEEMRMRYERRDPRQEDLREIAELRSRCESQERDLYLLTDRLREMQIQMSELQENGMSPSVKNVKKPLSKTLPTSCDVIYEENEERESPSPNNSETEENDESKKNKKELKSKIKGKNFNTINEDDSLMVSAV